MDLNAICISIDLIIIAIISLFSNTYNYNYHKYVNDSVVDVVKAFL